MARDLATTAALLARRVLVWQFEVDRDLSLNIDRRTIQVVGLVSPLPDGIHGGVRQHRISLQHLQVDDVSLFVDRGF